MNTDYKKYIISKGGNEIGLAWCDIQEYLLTPYQFKNFSDFMKGQTCAMIGGIDVVYTGDYIKFIRG